MQKTGKIEKLSIGDIRNTTKDNCTKLIDAIGAVVDRNLGMSCSVVSVNHSYEYKILITNKTSSVQLETKEKPGNTLRKTNEPTELHFFTYEKLKESAKLNHGKYRGKLYGTIELCKCDKTISCPDCDGTGICSSCDGENKLYAQFAMEIRNVYLAMELELIPARIAMAMEIAQNAMMVGILATSAMVTEPWTVLIVMALVIMLILHVISVEEVVIMIITITKFVERVVAPADL